MTNLANPSTTTLAAALLIGTTACGADAQSSETGTGVNDLTMDAGGVNEMTVTKSAPGDMSSRVADAGGVRAELTQALASCADTPRSLQLADSGQTLGERVAGTWYSCRAGGLFSRDEIGVTLDRDGVLHLLVLDGGQIVNSTTLLGSWQIGDNGTGEGGDPALLMQFGSEPGTSVYTPRFSNGFDRMVVEANGEDLMLIAASGP